MKLKFKTREDKQKLLKKALKFYCSFFGVSMILCIILAIPALINHDWLLGMSNLAWAYIAYSRHDDLETIQCANSIIEQQERIINKLMEVCGIQKEINEVESESNNNNQTNN